jgi:RNA polymerase sigma-70 factor (ECF subfamily)
MRQDDGALVRETIAGDGSAFSELVSRYRDAACGVAYHYLGSFEEAQDAAQEAFVRAYLRLRQLRDSAKFGSWLRRITATVCVDLLRRRGDRLLSLEEEGARAVSSVDEDLERLAARMVVREALGRLSERARLAVTLYYINGYSHGEIASFLDAPVSTIRTRLYRAKRKLREEMISMVTDTLHEGRPDPEFTKRVVEEALSRGEEAHTAHATAEALSQYDAALEALDKLTPGAERQRLRMDALWKKGAASQFAPGWPEAVALYEQALAIAEELRDRERQASMLTHIGATRSNMREAETAARCYEKALGLYRDLGNKVGEATCLFWLASQRLFANEAAQARPYLEEALPLFEAGGAPVWAAATRAAVALLQEVGESRFADLLAWSASCVVLDSNAGVVSVGVPGPAGGGGISTNRFDEEPAALFVHDVFFHITHLEKFLDASAPVGGSWSGDSFSYSYQPLRTTVTVRSKSEKVTVPAGSFENCLLMEQITVESGLPDPAPERQMHLNRKFRCGTRRAWYAPGVGLVQLRVQQLGAEALFELREFSVTRAEASYLPLAEGNHWSYRWADLPAQYAFKVAYRVAGRDGASWVLEQMSYANRRDEPARPT